MSQIGQADACVELRGASVEQLHEVYSRMIRELPAISRTVAARAAEWRALVLEQYAAIRSLTAA
jgi:hypothetical protein